MTKANKRRQYKARKEWGDSTMDPKSLRKLIVSELSDLHNLEQVLDVDVVLKLNTSEPRFEYITKVRLAEGWRLADEKAEAPDRFFGVIVFNETKLEQRSVVLDSVRSFAKNMLKWARENTRRVE